MKNYEAGPFLPSFGGPLPFRGEIASLKSLHILFHSIDWWAHRNWECKDEIDSTKKL